MKQYLKILKIVFLTIFSILFIFTTLLLISGQCKVFNYCMFLVVILIISTIMFCLDKYYSKFADKLEVKGKTLVFYNKNQTATYKMDSCTYIFTNGRITKFTLGENIIHCVNKDFSSTGNENLLDILNKENFPNAEIKDMSFGISE